MNSYPTTPLAAVRSHWTHSLEWKSGAGIPFGSANGESITSNSSLGVLKRLHTWLKRNDIGGEGEER